MDRTEKKDREGLAFIRSQLVHTGVAPSLREIGRAVGYQSPRSVQLMLDRLEKQGVIRRVDGVIHLTKQQRDTGERVVDVPLVGSVACGSPSLAEQVPEAVLQVSTKLARPGHKYFLLRAQGDSMDRSGINDGDLVLVRQQPIAEQGEKVVALVNDDATVKRFQRQGSLVVLRPESSNPAHKPIILTEDMIIQGVVVAALPASTYQ